MLQLPLGHVPACLALPLHLHKTFEVVEYFCQATQVVSTMEVMAMKTVH